MQLTGDNGVVCGMGLMSSGLQRVRTCLTLFIGFKDALSLPTILSFLTDFVQFRLNLNIFRRFVPDWMVKFTVRCRCHLQTQPIHLTTFLSASNGRI